MIFSAHQPSYFMWLGLLRKIAVAEGFILLDDVQLADRSFQHRNVFLDSSSKVKYLTIPISKAGYRSRTIREIEISDPNWGISHRNFFINSYRRHPFFNEIFIHLEEFFSYKGSLCGTVALSMALVMRLFDIKTPVVYQSQLTYDVELSKQELIIDLLLAVGASRYFSGDGARAYQSADSFRANGIELEYLSFFEKPYSQQGLDSFVPGLSSIDLLFNLGVQGSRAFFSDLIK